MKAGERMSERKWGEMKTKIWVATIVLCVAPSLIAPSVASAAVGLEKNAQTAAAVVDLVTPDDAAALQAVDRVVGQGESGSRTSVPAQAGQAATSLDRPQLAIAPRLNGHGKAGRSGTTALLGDSETSLKVAVQPLRGGVRILSVLKDSAAPSTTTYDVTLPEGAKMKLDSLGGAVVRENGKTTSRFSAPWAIDAAGRSLPTHYTLSGNALTQLVDTRGATFPVVADPKWIWDFVTSGYYFDKQETSTLAIVAGAAAGFATFAPPPFNILLQVYSMVLSLQAKLALNSGRCVYLDTAGLSHQYGGTTAQGFCR
jgi:hypothetical protein